MDNELIEESLEKLKGDNEVLPYLTSIGYEIATVENLYNEDELLITKERSPNIYYSLSSRKAYIAMPSENVTVTQGLYIFVRMSSEYLGYYPTPNDMRLAPFLMQLGYGILEGKLLFDEHFRIYRGSIQNKRIHHLVRIFEPNRVRPDYYVRVMNLYNPLNWDSHESPIKYYTPSYEAKVAALYAAKVLSKHEPNVVQDLIESMNLDDYDVIPSSVFTSKRIEAKKMIKDAARSVGLVRAIK